MVIYLEYSYNESQRDALFLIFPCVYKRMLRLFPSFQVATTCLSCSPPDLKIRGLNLPGTPERPPRPVAGDLYFYFYFMNLQFSGTYFGFLESSSG